MRTMLTLLLLLASISASAAETSPHGVVLMYHRFEENRYPTTNVRIEQFRAHLDYLQQEGFRIWPLRRLLTAIFDGEEVPDKTVALTVDDAYLSFYQQAYPILKARGIPLTVFVSTRPVTEHHWGYMNWDQMREMQRHNIDFANHGTDHIHLLNRHHGEDRQQWFERIRRDIEHAQEVLDNELGPQGQHLFAYPFGEYNSDVVELLGKLGYLAFGQHSGAIGTMSEQQSLPRFPMNEHFANLETFAIKVASLPMPITAYCPTEPELTDTNPPRLKLQLLNEGPLSAEEITCYLGSGRELSTRVINKWSLTVQAPSRLSCGRSRYNCTAPAANGRYYWFSHPWFNGQDPADPDY